MVTQVGLVFKLVMGTCEELGSCTSAVRQCTYIDAKLVDGSLLYFDKGDYR